MSSEKVQGFLQKLQDTKVKQEVQLRYEVLSYYDLGEKIYFEGEDNEDDYQLSEFDNYGKSRKFKYCCDISEDDYKIVYNEYMKESNPSEINRGAEKTLNICAVVLLVLGFVSLLAIIIVAVEEESWSLFGIGVGVFFTILMEFAFARVIVNISRKLNNLKK